jgi:hypothetical protein
VTVVIEDLMVYLVQRDLMDYQDMLALKEREDTGEWKEKEVHLVILVQLEKRFLLMSYP